MIYNDLIDDIKSADYVLFGLGKEIYSSDDTEIYDNLKKLFASMEHVNYFIVSTDKAGTIRNCGLNERRIVCPVNEKMAESRIKILSSEVIDKVKSLEEEDVLEAGIRIIAQPPGKKLQNMMQLSGGEKALTAIALLFAIQNLKPSPFCLLDEIEAALDDSNVGRYANYLHKLTKHTQFIVITHRRGTMAAADRLYGITMQEKGVSALVSVDLIANDLDKKKE